MRPGQWRRVAKSRLIGTDNQLRSVSSRNRIATTTLVATASAIQIMHRETHKFGSGDVSEFRMLYNNWRCSSSSVTSGPGNAIVLTEFYIVCNNIRKRITWSSALSRTVADGEIDVLSDALLPADFGLSAFVRDTTFEIRGLADVAQGGSICILEATITSASSRSYNPAVTVCTNINTNNFPIFTGTAPITSYGLSTMFVGKFTGARAGVWLGIGDSIIANGSNSFFAVSLDATPALAGITAGRGGGATSLWTTATGYEKLLALQKYGDRTLEEFGTNSLGTTANVGNTTTLNTTSAACWANLRANAVGTLKILRTRLTPRCASAGFNDASNSTQTPELKFSSSTSDSELFENYLTANVGILFDALVDPGQSSRIVPNDKTNADYYKWLPSSSTDGLHPSSTRASAISTADIRPAMDALG